MEYEHSTQFKEKMLKCIPESIKWEETFWHGKMIGKAILGACDLQDHGMCLEMAALIIQKEILSKQD